MSAMLKVLVFLLLVAIVGSLFSGLVFLYRDRGAGERTVRVLTWRIGLSIALFILLLIGFRFGFIPGYSQ
uniref:Transmembrane protein n=1 Tax=Dechloromonas aromatica (strain RCB) TaxID=159087 RepID=Q47G16_DECAR